MEGEEEEEAERGKGVGKSEMVNEEKRRKMVNNGLGRKTSDKVFFFLNPVEFYVKRYYENNAKSER